MSQQKGRLLLIRIGNGGSPVETFANLCGIKARSFNLSANEVETTIPDCNNPGLAVQRTSEPGIVQRTFSGGGAFVSGGTQAILLAHVRNGTVFNAEVIVPGDGTYTGPWMVSDFEFSGETEGNVEFSATFSAAGPLTHTPEAGAPANTLLPSISGIAQVGQTLTAIEGSWNGSPVFSYQWQEDDSGWVNISGATGNSYVVGAGVLGNAVRVVVTGTNTSGSTSVNSAATADVIAA